MLYFLKFWEIFLKTKFTKKSFLNYLRQNLKQKWITNIKFKNSYVIVETNKSVKVLQNTFWVFRLEAIKYNIPKTSNIQDFYTIIDNIVKDYNFNTFYIKAKREDKEYFLDSMDLQRKLWLYVYEKHNKQVLYKNPDIIIYVRILKDSIRIRTSQDSYKWVWWLPYGSEWRALTLFSWWIDSPVATFLAAKRGIRQDFLFLNIADSQLLLSQVFNIYTYLKENYWINGKFFTLSIQDVIQKIRKKVPSWYRQIVFKVFLYKIAEKITKKLWIKTVINGENIWQVSTQTLNNIQLLDSIGDTLHIIRPVACFDKTDIIQIAQNIWIFDMSWKVKETCNIENHSNARIKDKQNIIDLFENLDIDFNELSLRIHTITSTIDIDIINKYKTDKIIWKLIDIEKEEKIPKLEKWKQYTFVCSSWYKASSKVLQTRKSWYETYFKIASSK